MDKNESLEYKEYFEDLNRFRTDLSSAQALEEDFLTNNVICYDMQELTNELGGQDGIYSNLPITRVYRDENFVRVYALDAYGGVAIIATTIDKNLKRYQIVELGEDDAFYFMHGRRVYEDYHGTKDNFVNLLSKALSAFNNVYI